MQWRRILKSLLLIFVFGMVACNGSDLDEELENLDDIIKGVDRKPIDTSKLALNAFFNDSRFGSIPSQFSEIRGTLRLNSVRLLFAWNDSVQPSPGSDPFFGFYDEVASQIPVNMDAIVVVTGLPSWMANSANWIDGDPRKTFVQLWVRRVARRYAGNPRIIGYEIWNEPNQFSNPDNTTLGIATSAANYVSLLEAAFSTIRAISPGKLVLNAATTAINQNFPGTIDYNKSMQERGVTNFVDVYAAHYYGRQFERVTSSGGVADFLNGLGKEVWITESGAQGVNEQLAYGEQAWPFLIEKIPAIGRIYIYQFVEPTPPETTYGLRNLSPDLALSDLYIFAR